MRSCESNFIEHNFIINLNFVLNLMLIVLWFSLDIFFLRIL